VGILSNGNAGTVTILDEFLIASGKRKISLQRRKHTHKPIVIVVYVRSYGNKWVVLSEAEYADEEVARIDFEKRRPQMRDAADEDMPMQKGKRLIQEVMTEKLGSRK